MRAVSDGGAAPRVQEVAQALAVRMARLNPKWSRAAGAHGQCEQAAWRFRWALEERGIASELVTCDEPPHVAVVVSGCVIDLTARQFDSAAEYPMITTEPKWRAWLAAVSS